MGRREELGRAAEDEDGKARGIKNKGVSAGARHSTPFFLKVKPRLPERFRHQKRVPSQSTEAVDNSVHNLGEMPYRPYAMGLSVKLTIFSPMKKMHIFH
jgi:hypothetical protein